MLWPSLKVNSAFLKVNLVFQQTPSKQPSEIHGTGSKKVRFQYGSLRKVGSPGPLFCQINKRVASLCWRLESQFFARFLEIRGSSTHGIEARVCAFDRVLVLHRLDSRAESGGIRRPLGSLACSVRCNAAP